MGERHRQEDGHAGLCALPPSLRLCGGGLLRCDRHVHATRREAVCGVEWPQWRPVRDRPGQGRRVLGHEGRRQVQRHDEELRLLTPLVCRTRRLLVQGVDAPKAVGYSFAVMLVSLIDGLFVTKSFEDVSDDKMPAYIWMAIQSAVVGLTVVM